VSSVYSTSVNDDNVNDNVLWCLIFVNSQCGTCICHASGTLNSEVAPKFLDNLCAPGVPDSFCITLHVIYYTHVAIKYNRLYRLKKLRP